MFEWFIDDISKAKTPKFHVVDGTASSEFRKEVEHSELPIPPSYERFVLQFGNAKLYRQGSVYLVQVFACPLEAESMEGEALLQFGRTDMSLAFFKRSLLARGQETPVFEWLHGKGLWNTANDFEEWLKCKCADARRTFRKKEWEGIARGPKPFSDHEKAIVEARHRFRWRLLGVASNGDLRFEVFNGSGMTLPYLSIGIRGKLRPPKEGNLDGCVWLPASSIPPGETKVIEKNCYKDLVDPCDVQAFDKPRPEPEDRDRYWEFKGDS